LKWRILAAFIGLVTIVLLVEDIPIANYLKTVERDRILKTLQRDAFIIAAKSEEEVEKGVDAQISFLETLATDYRNNGGARVVITNVNGIALASSDDDQSAEGSNYLTRPEIEKALTGVIATGNRFSTTLDQELLFVAVPIFNGNSVIGAVRLTYPAKFIDAEVNKRVQGLIVVALVTLLMATFLALLLSRSVTKYLDRLKKDTEKFANGELAVRANDKEGAPEIRSLAASFNIMAERISRLIEKQKGFAADASHQLRTPLTALRLRLEQASDLVETDSKLAKERLEIATVELQRLQQVVEGLLVLSKSEKSNAKLVKIDAVKISKERIESWTALAEESSVSFDIEAPNVAFIEALEGAFEQILDNYIDNAIEVAPAETKILVRIISINNLVELHVIDTGPGMSEEGRLKAFNRFWRGRSDSNGTGLGLAIVQELINASGGNCELLSNPSGGTNAVARFRSIK